MTLSALMTSPERPLCALICLARPPAYLLAELGTSVAGCEFKKLFGISPVLYRGGQFEWMGRSHCVWTNKRSQKRVHENNNNRGGSSFYSVIRCFYLSISRAASTAGAANTTSARRSYFHQFGLVFTCSRWQQHAHQPLAAAARATGGGPLSRLGHLRLQSELPLAGDQADERRPRTLPGRAISRE